MSSVSPSLVKQDMPYSSAKVLVVVVAFSFFPN